MHYVAVYLLAVLSSNDSPNFKNLMNILESNGIEADEEWLKAIGKFSNKNMEDIISQGSSKLTSMGFGVGFLPSEESNDDMGCGLFD
ncbi:60S acidic ribosomal protein P2-like [Gracilinanus agilis]|uniref:60S acidic ribosomal protein P2-like n=1 Tax=Gracilinanus agilis TaxID=191870 RepID=UPI001CFF4F0B|nr:60S acidic ribosomal protein P2-like [Gracilinanus agilis]